MPCGCRLLGRAGVSVASASAADELPLAALQAVPAAVPATAVDGVAVGARSGGDAGATCGDAAAAATSEARVHSLSEAATAGGDDVGTGGAVTRGGVGSIEGGGDDGAVAPAAVEAVAVPAEATSAVAEAGAEAAESSRPSWLAKSHDDSIGGAGRAPGNNSGNFAAGGAVLAWPPPGTLETEKLIGNPVLDGGPWEEANVAFTAVSAAGLTSLSATTAGTLDESVEAAHDS